MTREEAKEILTHNWTRVDNPNYSESELDEAFFMAIEALSADAEKVEIEALQAKVMHQADRVNALLEENTDLKLEVDYYKSNYETACLIIDTNHEMIQTYTKIFKMQEAELQKLRKEALDV